MAKPIQYCKVKKKKKNSDRGTSLAVQCLRLASTAERTDLIPG